MSFYGLVLVAIVLIVCIYMSLFMNELTAVASASNASIEIAQSINAAAGEQG